MPEKEKLIELIHKLQKIRNTPQFLFHDNVFPASFIEVRKAVQAFKQKNSEVKEIDLIVNSGGGMADDAYRIIRTFRKNFDVVNVIIPFWAKSAATLLSLGGSKIIMDELGEFGPLDAQIGKQRDDGPHYDRESALTDEHTINRIETRFKELYESMYIRLFEHDHININKIELSKQLLENSTKFYEPLLSQINPYRLGEKRRILDIGEHYAKRILAQFNAEVDADLIRRLVDYLVNGCPDHGYIVDFDVISRFLPNVYTSDHFGQEYKQALIEISSQLIEVYSDRNFTFVNFVENTDDIPLSDETISNNSTFKQNGHGENSTNNGRSKKSVNG